MIPRGRYRNALRSLVAALESWNYDVILPHQDINKWGFNNLSHKEIAERCLDAVKHADAFVGLIGDSYGAHTELGVAIGAELPSLVVLLADANTSFFGAAVSQSKYVKAVRVASIAKAISMFKQTDLIRHLLFS